MAAAERDGLSRKKMGKWKAKATAGPETIRKFKSRNASEIKAQKSRGGKAVVPEREKRFCKFQSVTARTPGIKRISE